MNKARRGVLLTLCMAMMCAAGAWGQQVKRYIDYANGYNGVACANYLGDERTYSKWWSSYQYLFEHSRDAPLFEQELQKLSKEEIYLSWRALNEYNIKDGEIYSVIVSHGSLPCVTIWMIVQITEGGKNYKYMGNYHEN